MICSNHYQVYKCLSPELPTSCNLSVSNEKTGFIYTLKGFYIFLLILTDNLQLIDNTGLSYINNHFQSM